MSLPRFHVHDLSAELVTLERDEAHHAIHVRRVRVGDEVSLFDDAGTQADGVVAAMSRGVVQVRIERRCRPPPAAASLTLAVAPPKGARAEWLVEKAAELGVAAIWPIRTARGVVEPREHRLDKWRRIAREANKQSGRADAMRVEPLMDFGDALARRGRCATVIADMRGSAPFAVWLKQSVPDPPPTSEQHPRSDGGGEVAGFHLVALIGPEGGWTEAELATAREAGAAPVCLADHVLRVETAAIALAATFAALMRAR